MSRLKYLLFIAILFTQQLALAQPVIDLLSMKSTYYPGRVFEQNERFEQSTFQTTAELFLPAQVKNNLIIICGANYDRQQLFLKEGDHTFKESSTILQQISLQTGFIKKFRDRYKIMLLAIPKFSEVKSALRFQRKYFQLGGAALLTYEKSKRLKYKIGLYYNREFFGNFFMPLLGIDWKINERVYLFGVLPGAMNIEYKIRNGLYTGISYRSITTSYSLGHSYIREGDPFWGHNLMRGFCHFYLNKHLVLGTELGCNAFRFFQEYTAAHLQVNTNTMFQRTGNQYFVGLSMAFKVRLDKDYE